MRCGGADLHVPLGGSVALVDEEGHVGDQQHVATTWATSMMPMERRRGPGPGWRRWRRESGEDVAPAADGAAAGCEVAENAHARHRRAVGRDRGGACAAEGPWTVVRGCEPGRTSAHTPRHWDVRGAVRGARSAAGGSFGSSHPVDPRRGSARAVEKYWRPDPSEDQKNQSHAPQTFLYLDGRTAPRPANRGWGELAPFFLPAEAVTASGRAYSSTARR